MERCAVMSVRDRVEKYLADIAELTVEVAREEVRIAARIAIVVDELKPGLEALKEGLVEHEKALERLAKAERKDLFGDRDRVDLKAGAVLLSDAKRVRKARCVLAKLKGLGLDDDETVKRVEAVNWDALEKWTDEQLKKVGTKRVKKTVFGYELKGGEVNG